MAILDGLIGCWSPSLGASGYRLQDRTRYGNHGTLTNMDAGTDWVASPVGVSLDFDGVNDGVSLGTKEFFNPASYNVELWFTASSIAAGQKSIFSQIDATGNIGKAIRRNAGKIEFTVAASGSSYRVWTSNSTYAALAVTHAVVSWDSTNTPRIWINGAESSVTLAATSGSLPAPAAHPLYIGCDGAFGQTSTSFNFAGQVHSAAMWNRPITPPEVSKLYQLGNGWIGRRSMRPGQCGEVKSSAVAEDSANVSTKRSIARTS